MPTQTYPGRYASLAKISEFVAKSAAKAGFDNKEVYAVKLAVDEACTNIIEHGYGGEGKGKIRCTCDVTSGQIKITLEMGTTGGEESKHIHACTGRFVEVKLIED